MNAIYIPWTIAAIRRAAGRKTISIKFEPETRMLLISRWLIEDGCTLQWDTKRRSLIVVPAYPRPYRPYLDTF